MNGKRREPERRPAAIVLDVQAIRAVAARRPVHSGLRGKQVKAVAGEGNGSLGQERPIAVPPV
jgi:hypothetical protein